MVEARFDPMCTAGGETRDGWISANKDHEQDVPPPWPLIGQPVAQRMRQILKDGFG